MALFESRDDLLEPCGPLPLNSPNLLNHKYPRFKQKGKISFWQLVPASYSHLNCEPENIEWSFGMSPHSDHACLPSLSALFNYVKGGIPYPKLNLYVQRAIDIKDGVELQDLIDGMDLSEEWGEENLNLDGTTDTEWLENYYQAFCADFRKRGKDDMLVFIDPTPTSRRQIWERSVRNKQRRLGWKYSPERYATRYRKHGSIDPRTRNRPGV